MINDPLTPEEQDLVRWLENIQKPILNSTSVERIQSQLIKAAAAPIAKPQAPIAQKFLLRPVLAIVTVVIALIGLSWHLVNQQEPTPAALVSVTATPTPEIVATTSTIASPAASAAPSLSAGVSNVLMVVDGPVNAKQGNTVQIYDFTIQLAPNDPMLSVIQPGDWLHVTSTLDKNGLLVAQEVDNPIAATQGGTALVEGRVQAINGTTFTINGVTVSGSPDDPTLKSVKVGSFLSVSGNFSQQGTSVVLVVVHVVVIKDADVNTFLYCRAHAGMGKPDAMGMGDDAMGMGNPSPPPPPDAMGMGDDGMGMGMGSDQCLPH